MFFLLKSLPSVFELEPFYKYYEQIQSSRISTAILKKSSHFKVKQNKETQTPDLTELVPPPQTKEPGIDSWN